MNEADNPRSVLLAYLLGELPPGVRERLEERVLSDQDFSDQLQEAEYDLIDDYHAARLRHSERRRVEKAFPRERLIELSAPYTGRIENQEGAFTKNAGSRSTQWLGARLFLASAILAVVVVASLSSYLYLRSRTSRLVAAQRTTAERQSPPSIPSGKGAPQSQPGSLADERAATATLVLFGDAVRGAISSTLELHPDTRTVTVQWVVPPGNSETAFQLSIVHDNSPVIAVKQTGIQQMDGRRVVEFPLKPSDFAMRSSEAHDLFVIRTGAAGHAIEGEYSVLVLLK